MLISMRFLALPASVLFLAGTLADPRSAYAEGTEHGATPAPAAPTPAPGASAAPVSASAAPPASNPALDTRAKCVSEHEQTQIERKKEALIEARAAALSCSQPECPGLLRADCVQWFAEVDREVPSVVISVRAGANDVSAASVRIDGRPYPRALDGQLLELDPGQHLVEVLSAEQPALSREVVLAAGEKARLLVFEMASSQSLATSAPAAQTAPHPTHRPVQTVTWVLSGTAVAAVAAGSVFGALSLSKRNDLERTPAAGGCSPYCSDNQVAPVHHLSLTADVFFGLATLSAVGAAVSYALRPDVPLATTSQLQWDFGLAKGSASVGVRGSL